MKYIVKVTETLARTLVVEAENEGDAIVKADMAYVDGEIVLDYDDFDEYNVSVLRKATADDYKFYDILE